MPSYRSPFLHPQPYIRDVNRFSAEGIAIDEAVARAVRQATADFSNEYSSGWPLVSGHKDNTAQFNEVGFPVQSTETGADEQRVRLGPGLCSNLEMLRRPFRPCAKVR
jgi:hypothetical protein